MKEGRPTLYTEHTVAQAEQYLEDCKDKYTAVPIYTEDGDVVLDQDGVQKTRMKKIVNLPSIAGLARYLKVSRETIYAWSSQPEKIKFSDIVGQVLIEQEQRLLSNGISGEYNCVIAKLILTKHGYSDKQELSGVNGNPIESIHKIEWEVIPSKRLEDEK